MRTELAKIAVQYAEALLDLALTAGGDIPESVLSDLEAINAVVASTPDFNTVLAHPSVSSADKKQLLVSTFENVVNDLTLRFLQVLADRRRVNLLPYVESSYRELLNARKNIAVASLTSADELSDAAVEEIRARLARRLGKQVELTVKVDPTLVGGVVLRVGDEVIDGSLKGRLAALEASLLSV
jgi:F-type H+-transporting ATPase subunit delta